MSGGAGRYGRGYMAVCAGPRGTGARCSRCRDVCGHGDEESNFFGGYAILDTLRLYVGVLVCGVVGRAA